MDTIFGKKVFFTNRNDWTDREIIEAYHGQSKIEKIFRHLKNPYHLAIRPQFHWTDHKIKVHTFICLLGLRLAEILRKKAHDAGIKMSLDDILYHLILGNQYPFSPQVRKENLELRCNLRRWMRLRKSYLRW